MERMAARAFPTGQSRTLPIHFLPAGQKGWCQKKRVALEGNSLIRIAGRYFGVFLMLRIRNSS